MSESKIVQEVSEFVKNLFDENLNEGMVYHDMKHTMDTVQSAIEIGEAEGISDDEMEIIKLSAWFHDCGYTEKYKGHEELSINCAQKFLSEKDYPEERIKMVLSCIQATRMPQVVTNKLDGILADADLSNLGKSTFLETSDLLKKEMDNMGVNMYKDKAHMGASWYEMGIYFLSNHKYHTESANRMYDAQKLKNIEKLRSLMEEQKNEASNDSNQDPSNLGKGPAKSKKAKKKADKSNETSRGVETMFRTSLRTHIDLSAIADNKANIMLSINAIIISIVLSALLPRLYEETALVIPTVILLTVCVVTVIFATISTIPSVTSGKFTKEDITQKKANLLFFGNFHRMPLEEFQWGINEMMKDRDFLYGSMARDFYNLGKVLSRKYYYLRISYLVFVFGLVTSIIAFVIAFLSN